MKASSRRSGTSAWPISESTPKTIRNVSDTVADELVASAEASQAARSALLKKYYGQMKAAFGAKIAARFLQVENAIANLIDLQLSSEIPLMP
jgi:hypothetical protein